MSAPYRKPFSWSWSKLKNYRTCPKRHYEIDLARNYKDEDSDALKWGNEVHDAMAKRLSKGTPLPVTMQRYEDWPQRILKMRDAGAKMLVEQKYAIDKEFRACGYFDASAWFRAIADVLLLLGDTYAITIDWKTGGKVQPEFEQLGLSSQAVFAHYPTVTHIVAIYVWLGHDRHTVKLYTRDGMAPLWNELWPEINLLTHAWNTTTYPAKPSGLCKRYCPVKNCPHHGVGSQ